MRKIESKNKFVDKSSAHGMFHFDKDGILKIGGITAYMTPMASLAIQNHLLVNYLNKKKVNDIFYYAGKIQGIVAVRLLRDKFGVKKKIFETIIEQLAMIGLGRNEVVMFDEKNRRVILKKSVSPFPELCVKIFGYQKHAICHFHRGDIAGVLGELFGEEMLSIEKDCKVQGKNFCINEAFPRRLLHNKKLGEQEKLQIPEPEENFPELKKLKNNCTLLYLK